jgi:hypothetical protein
LVAGSPFDPDLKDWAVIRFVDKPSAVCQQVAQIHEVTGFVDRAANLLQCVTFTVASHSIRKTCDQPDCFIPKPGPRRTRQWVPGVEAEAHDQDTRQPLDPRSIEHDLPDCLGKSVVPVDHERSSPLILLAMSSFQLLLNARATDFDAPAQASRPGSQPPALEVPG